MPSLIRAGPCSRPRSQTSPAARPPRSITETAAGAPPLLIAGAEDHIVPAAVTRSNFRKYRHSGAVTDFREFPGRSHLILVEQGWREVIDYAHEWLTRVL